MTRHLRPAFAMLLLFTLLTGLVYPLAVTGLARLFFPGRAAGSIIMRRGVPVGSVLIGQPFDDPSYFWGRPSATTPHPFNAGASGGSNFGPGNPSLLEAVNARLAALRTADPGHKGPVPADLACASGSGLDPHISPAAAEFQVPRVARARGLGESRVRDLVTASSEGRQLGMLGEPRVNVLLLNLALDEIR